MNYGGGGGDRCMKELSLPANFEVRIIIMAPLSIFAALSYKLHTATKRYQHT
jgi:hypothetical protein